MMDSHSLNQFVAHTLPLPLGFALTLFSLIALVIWLHILMPRS